jgi:hypothetical protein
MNHEQAIREAEDKLYAVERQYRLYGEAAKQVRDDEIKALSEPVERRYREAMEQLRTTWEPRIKAAQSELDALKLAAAEQGRGLADGLTLGRIVWEWKRGTYGRFLHAPSRRGRIEIFRQGDPEPLNAPRYGRANVGDYIVRIITKSGQAGKEYVRLPRATCGTTVERLEMTDKHELPHGWYPEGVDPNKEK